MDEEEEDGTVRPPEDGAPPCPSTDGMVELGRLSGPVLGRDRDSASSSADEGDGGDGADECDDECDDDDDDDRSEASCDGVLRGDGPADPSRRGGATLHLLGRRYSLPFDARSVESRRRSLCYLTYRSGFAVPLVPYPGGGAASALGSAVRGGGVGALGGGGGGMTTDAGWGCMLRSVQMMTAEAVRRHYNADAREGRDRPDDPHEAERVARWFADLPDRADSLSDGDDLEDDGEEHGTGGLDRHWYSLHCLVAAGIGLGVLPGEWYGPNDACHAVRELNEVHVASRAGSHPGRRTDVFRVHVATGGVVYLDAVEGLMAGRVREEDEGTAGTGGGGPDGNDGGPETDPLRAFLREEEALRAAAPIERPEWDASLLLLVPLRLGLDSVSTEAYGRSLPSCLGLPQSVGMVGGTPRRALWFYGADAPGGGGMWYGLDPHAVRPAARGELVPARRGGAAASASDEGRDLRWRAVLDDAYLRSLRPDDGTGRTNNHRPLPLSGLDPSVALGFYVRDRTDMYSLVTGLRSGSGARSAGVVAVEDRAPDYGGRPGGGGCVDADVLSVGSGVGSGEGSGDDGADDGDDDFVMV